MQRTSICPGYKLRNSDKPTLRIDIVNYRENDKSQSRVHIIRSARMQVVIRDNVK